MESESKNALYLKADECFDAGQYEKAIEYYDKVIEIDPKHVDALCNKGRSLGGIEKYEEALDWFNQALAINPTHVLTHTKKGNTLYNLTKYEEAIQCYDKALEADPKHAEALINKGHVLYNLTKYEEAIQYYDKALEADPKHAEALINKGYALYNLTKYEDAIVCWDKLLEINPKHAEALINKGNSLYNLTKYEEAIQYYDKALEADPKCIAALDNKKDALTKIKNFNSTKIEEKPLKQQEPLKNNDYASNTSLTFEGHDPILTIIYNYFYNARLKENSKVFNNFKHQLDFGWISEDVAVLSVLKTQYENFSTTHYAVPVNKWDIGFYSKERRLKMQPAQGEFVRKTIEIAKEETSNIISCTCSSGKYDCPNCKSTTVVTCPQCHTYRSGKCISCAGGGKVRCDRCNGNRHCVSCGGDGKVQCNGCYGAGYLNKERSIPCSSCYGTGGHLEWKRQWITDFGTNGRWQDTQEKINCIRCYGSGNIQESYRESHYACSGSGKITCSGCGGSGKCTRCSGSGNIVCSTCGGNGRCKNCSGYGTNGCPTCKKIGHVVCPLCEGKQELLLFSSEVFHYHFTKDSAMTIPSSYEIKESEIPQSQLAKIKVNSLDDAVIQSSLGIYNDGMRTTVSQAGKANARLFENSKKREFVKDSIDDYHGQQKALDKLTQFLDYNWTNTKSDSVSDGFLTNFSYSQREINNRTHLDENSLQLSTRSSILFQESEYDLIPVSITALEINEKPLKIRGIGTKNSFELKTIQNNTDVKFADDLTTLDYSREILSNSSDGKPSKISSILSFGLVKSRDITKLVLIIGDDEEFKRLTFNNLGKTILKKGVGKINDHLFTQISLEDNLGSSSAYSVSVDEQKRIVFVNVNRSSLIKKIPVLKALTGACDIIIWLTKKTQEIETIGNGILKDKIIAVLYDCDIRSLHSGCLETFHHVEQIDNEQFFAEILNSVLLHLRMNEN